MSAVTLFEGIELLSGAYMDYKHPEQSEATIEDIGHALSNVCRFAGHLPRFYSVAQHVVNVSRVVEELGGDRWDQFEGLMHDTAEAFTNDLPTPLKAAFPIFKELEVKIEAAMAKRFKFGFPYCDLVKQADLILLGLEKVHVKGCSADWSVLEGIDFEQYRSTVNLSKMIPARAYDFFMDAYQELRT
jgi:hypothetical protein